MTAPRDTIHVARSADAADPTVVGMLVSTYLRKYRAQYPGEQLVRVVLEYSNGEKLNIRFHPELAAP